jgi:hypothetical protein
MHCCPSHDDPSTVHDHALHTHHRPLEPFPLPPTSRTHTRTQPVEITRLSAMADVSAEQAAAFEAGPLRDLSLWCVEAATIAAAARLAREVEVRGCGGGGGAARLCMGVRVCAHARVLGIHTPPLTQALPPPSPRPPTQALLCTWLSHSPLVSSHPSLSSPYPSPEPHPPATPLPDHVSQITDALASGHRVDRRALLSAALRHLPPFADWAGPVRPLRDVTWR